MDIGIHSRQEESVEIKDEMLMGLYNAELKETCLFWMPKELQHENEIKAVLDHKLVNMRMYNMDPHQTCETVQ